MSRHILIVDNDPYVLQLLEAVLLADGYSVTACGGPEEALQRIGARAPDLLITDVMMPAMTGMEMLKRARSVGFTGRCLMISGLSVRAIAEPALASGADMILPKPVDLVDLLSHVMRLLPDPRPVPAVSVPAGVGPSAA